MKQITGYSKSNKSNLTKGGVEYADELNNFYARFDVHNFKKQHNEVLQSTEVSDDCQQPLSVSVDDVKIQLKRLNARKAAGPDGVRPKVLKVCADQLCYIFHTIFSTGQIPSLWKNLVLCLYQRKSISHA